MNVIDKQYLIDVEEFKRYHPIRKLVYKDFQFQSLVQNCLSNNDLEEKSFQAIGITYNNWTPEENDIWHARRVAYLVKNKAEDPIVIDVGIPELNYYHLEGIVIEDGHHRVIAAMIRGDKQINVGFSGQTSTFFEFFPNAKLIENNN